MQADREVKAIFDEIKDEFSAETGMSRLADFEVHSYITQIVGGTNYFIKVSAKWFHLRVFKPLRCENQPASLEAVLLGKSIDRDTPLKFF